MHRLLPFLLVLIAAATSSVQGFASSSLGGVSGGSNFVVSQRPRFIGKTVARSNSRTSLQMGGSQAKFGVFSPAVYGAKIVLGDLKLKKFRGKAISLHSQYIGEFCQWAGAYHLRTRLIKLAKTNGDTLGFLV